MSSVGHLLFLGCVMSLLRSTRVLNLSPRKLSGVLREADVAAENGLVLSEFEFVPPAMVG